MTPYCGAGGFLETLAKYIFKEERPDNGLVLMFVVLCHKAVGNSAS
jgi:hypothetical protein